MGRNDRILLVALGLVLLLLPVVVKNPYYILVANIVGLNAIVVIGLNLLIGYAGQISLGHGAFYGLGAYMSGVLTATYGLPAWPTVLLTMVITGVIAYIIGVPSLKLKGHYLVMATLGFNVIVYICMIEMEDITGGPSGFAGIPHLTLGGFAVDSDIKFYYLVWFICFLVLVGSLNLVNSRVGRGLRAIHGSEVAANTLGVNTRAYKVHIFVFSAVLASLAGSLYAHYITFISPKTFDFFYSIKVVIMVIVGGMGSIWGSIVGTVILTSLPEILEVMKEYNVLIYGLILAVVLIFFPEGLILGLVNIYRRRKIEAMIKAEEGTGR